MNRFFKTFLLGLIIFVGAWLLFNRQQIRSVSDAWSLARYQVGGNSNAGRRPFQLASTSDYVPATQTPNYSKPVTNFVRQNNSTQFRSSLPNRPALQRANPGTIRIASFKLDSTSTGGNVRLTADICQQYDVVAIQNSSGLSISKLVNDLNRRGYDFRFVDKVGTNQRFATIFNQQTVVLEEQHWYTVNDPEDLFLFEPLVAWFRVRNAQPDEAFTFSLANVQLNDRKPDQEMSYLGQLFRAIRLDGRGEDDIILAGDFFSSDKQLKKLEKESGLTATIVGLATNTRKDMQFDNILLEDRATVEFSGESGVFDFMKRFNMTLVEALAISNRMPVWAEFSIFEGRSPGRAAERSAGFNR